MPDIRVCHELVNKAEVYEIASALDLDVNATVGILIRVWIWADQHTSDGHSRHHHGVLESIIGVPGLTEALNRVGWIELLDKGFRFPNLDRYTGDGRTTKSRRNKARVESKDKARGANGRFKAKNPASTSTSEGAGTSPGPDRSRTVPEPNRTVRELTSGERYLAGSDERVDRVLKPWKEALLIGSPVRAREAVWRALVDKTEDALLEASKAYLGSSAASEKKYACRAHTFFGEERYLMDPEEWNRGGPDVQTPSGWDALEATHE